MSFVDNSDDPFSVAAKRIRLSVIRPNSAPQLPIQGRQQPTTYIIEPDLMEIQTGNQHLPNDVAFDDAGFAYNTITGNPVQIVRRPNVLPVAKTPEGFTFAMPKMLDVVGNVMGGVAGAPVKGAEVLVGSGVVRAVKEKPWTVKGFENANWYHGTTHEFDKFKLAKGNPENHLGQYPHFTTSVEDASSNYAGLGPDLTSRIERRAEDILATKNIEWRSSSDPEYLKAKAQATKELKGHEGAIIPAKMNLQNPVSLVDEKPTWLDFNAKYNKDGEWIADSPNIHKLLNSLKKQGDKYGFDGQKVFDDISEKAGLYEGEVRASVLDKALRESDYMIDASNDKGALVSSHVISNVFKDLGFDGIVMDAKAAFPHMKNIPEGTLHAVPLKRNTVKGKYNDQILYSDTRPQVTNAIGHAVEKQTGPFYSALERTVDNAKIGKASPEQWLGYLKNQPGVKQEELAYVLGNLPEGPISKEALSDIIKNNKVELKEVVKGEKAWDSLTQLEIKEQEKQFKEVFGYKGSLDEIKDFYNGSELSSPTKYHDYQLPGGENYQEMLLTLPAKRPSELKYTIEQDSPNKFSVYRIIDGEKELYNTRATKAEAEKDAAFGTANDKITNRYVKDTYKSSHWDEPNILAHVRYNDRDIPDVGKSLHLEEIQSDWHQAGRKQGYKGLSSEEKARKEALDVKPMSEWSEADTDWYNSAVNDRQQYAVPDAPFKKTWDELAFKRMLHKAAAEGYDSVSWTPGEAQAARYDLSKHLDSVGYQKRGENTYNITAWGKNGGSVWSNQSATPEMIEQHLGKEMADKIIKGTGRKEGNLTYLEDLDLKVGGEGMKSFYDKMLVDKANALAKKYGAKVETKNISLNPDWSIKKYISDQGHPRYRVLDEDGDQLITFEFRSQAEDYINSNNIKQPIHVLKLTPELRAKAKEGFPLFSSTPITTPVDYDPWSQNKKYKLTPIEGNPFK